MHKPGEIRVLALGIVRACDRVFLSEGYDPKKQQTFYRAMGGGVDFGETSLEALHREFDEEIQAQLTNVRYLGCVESLFTYNDQPGHEILFVYECDFVEPKFYQIEKLDFKEGKRKKTAVWVEISRFKTGEFKLVPAPCLDYL